MQAVADFYAGFALFMLVGSLIGLATVILQPVFDHLRSVHLRPGGRPSSAGAGTDDPSVRPQPAGLRKAA